MKRWRWWWAYHRALRTYNHARAGGWELAAVAAKRALDATYMDRPR